MHQFWVGKVSELCVFTQMIPLEGNSWYIPKQLNCKGAALPNIQGEKGDEIKR